MKNLLIIMSLALSFQAFAQEAPKDAPVQCVQPPKKKKKPIVHKKVEEKKEQCTQVTNNEYVTNVISIPEEQPKKNSVGLLLGVGPRSVSQTVSGNVTTYGLNRGGTIGVEYVRHMVLMNAGFQVLSNGTMLLHLGLDFNN